MKWLISVLLLAGCSGWGYVLAAELAKRTELLGELKAALQTLQRRIEYFSDPIEQALRQSAELVGSHAKELFEAIALRIHTGCGAQEAMKIELDVLCKKDPVFACLMQKDILVLVSFAQKMGMNSLAQKAAFEFIHEHLNEEIEAAQRKFASHARLYRASGLLTGLLLIVLFW